MRESFDDIGIALVLEGGAMRGMYTAGVLDYLMDEGIWVDQIIGVSAGALFGVNYLSKQRGRVIRYNKRFNSDKNYIGLKPLLKEGNIINTKYAFDDVPKRLDPFDNKAFMKSNVPFYAVVTRMSDGKPEYIKIEDVFEQMDTLRASGAMPFVSKPVRIGSESYLDGGISDSIPFRFGLSEKNTKAIVILTRDESYRKKPMSKFPIKLFYRKYPGIVEQLVHRHEKYNKDIEELERLEKEGRVFLIRPSSPITIGKMESDPEKLQEVYEMGVEDAKKRIDTLREFVKQYRCPCCSQPTYTEKPGKSYQICSNCGWEDDPVQLKDPDFRGGANPVSLNEARKNYLKYGRSTKAE